MLTADLHCHTIYSHDSCNRMEWIIDRCTRIGITCLAVTDHNRIEGAFELQRSAPFRIIVGEEVDTGEGEIIGMFLKRWIAPLQGLKKTIMQIKAQDALVYLPHPLSISRDSSLNITGIRDLYSEIDIVEVFNARTRKESSDREWLSEWLHRRSVVKSAGSDAHSPYELGNVLIEMDDFTSGKEFLQSLNRARSYVRKSSPYLRLILNHIVRKAIRRCSLPLRPVA
jgi:predicted metal-dependent phosphoesterase TrpH